LHCIEGSIGAVRGGFGMDCRTGDKIVRSVAFGVGLKIATIKGEAAQDG
jgi:hypothetical protein